MSAVYSQLLHCPLIHPVCPSTSSPNTKFCISFVFILCWGGGGGADYCNVPPVIAGRNWKQCCFGEGLGGGGTKSLLRSNAKVANFRVGCDVSCYRLFIFSYFLFHHGYGCRENATRGVPLQLSLLEGISPSLSKLLFIFPVSCPVVRSWLFWGVKPFVDTFSPCPCLGVATSCSTSLQSLSSSGSVLLS